MDSSGFVNEGVDIMSELDEGVFGEDGGLLREQGHLDYNRDGCLEPAAARGAGERLGLCRRGGDAHSREKTRNMSPREGCRT